VIGRRRLGAALLASVPAACAPVDLLNDSISGNGVQVTRGVPYAPGPRGMLDIYRPTRAQGLLPVVVFIYGGSWNSGRRRDYLFVAGPLAAEGMVVVVPDYRLFPEVRFPAFVEDAAAAIAWTLRHVADYGGNPSDVFVMGHSAGAHIAAMVALDPAFLAAAGADRSQLAGFIGLAGPYDFLPITDPDIKPIFAGSDPAATQPINFVDGHNPPALLLAGDADETVDPANTTRLAARIRERGGPVEAKIYPGLAHIGIVIAIAPLFRDRAPVLADVMAFIRAHPGAAAAAAPVSGAPTSAGGAFPAPAR
jgi:acetyl esterase/lipase